MPESRATRLVGTIYDAALEPALWVDVMEGLAAELAGATACMTTLDVHTGVGWGCAALAPTGTMEDYFAHWAQDNPLHRIDDPLRYVQDWRANVIRYEDWVEPATLHRSGFFNDFLQPLGAGNGIMMGLALIGTSTVTMNIARPLGRGPFSDAELAIAGRWQAHLSRAVRLGQAVQVSRASLDAIDRLIAMTPHRLFFLDGRGHVRRLSGAAEAMLSEGSDLHLAGGILSACRPDDDATLRRLIASAGRQGGVPLSGGAMGLRCRDGRLLELQVAPLSLSSVASWSSEPLVMVTVLDGRAPALPIELRLRRRFGFTPAEARVALAVMRGDTLRETADAAGISINTVRVQIAGIFRKTGFHRQVELARALLTFERNG